MRTDDAADDIQQRLETLRRRKEDLAKQIVTLKKRGVSLGTADWRQGQSGEYLYIVPEDNKQPPEYIGTDKEEQQRALDRIARGQEVIEIRQQIAVVEKKIKAAQDELQQRSNSPSES
ncbi:MAG: hypothetical protein AMJ53_04595 [Gammaproteobacteria bacterium SG8_11]|nr:MAG: hypothetical protein AMJ53_04595 [Gammaproteobacteria bacterium SG8_11]